MHTLFYYSEGLFYDSIFFSDLGFTIIVARGEGGPDGGPIIKNKKNALGNFISPIRNSLTRLWTK